MISERDLLYEISNELGIKKDKQENETQWINRVIYSSVAKLAIASVWSNGEDYHTDAIIHFKNHCKKLLNAYLNIFPDSLNMFSPNYDELSEEIYKILLSAGCFYHMPYRLSPAVKKLSVVNNIVLARGLSPDNDFNMSGMGFYIENSSIDSQEDVFDMFNISRATFDRYVDQIIKNKEWIPAKFDKNIEDYKFLKTQPPFTNGYWKKEPDKENVVSLARISEINNSMYFLYKYDNGKYFELPLENWRTEYFQYRAISTGILQSCNKLPPISAKLSDEIVYIKLNYLLPPNEESFFKLYSWPINYLTTDQNFNRIMSKKIYNVFKTILKQSGYQFREEE